MVANAIIASDKSLGMILVAQGVENPDQVDFLRAHACIERQGFYFKRPLPAHESTTLLIARATAHAFTAVETLSQQLEDILKRI